jgi:hypothetical protein
MRRTGLAEVLLISAASCLIGEPGTSVCIVSGYGLDDRGLIPGRGERILPVASVYNTGTGAHQASCTMGTGGPFPGSKARPGSDADHSLQLVSRMSRSYAFSPPKRLRSV